MTTPYTLQERTDLDRRILFLAGECHQINESFRDDLTQEESLPRYRRYTLVAKKCIDFLMEVKHQHDSCAVMLREAPSKHWQALPSLIIPFAMSRDSEHFTELSQWIGSTWIGLKPQILVPRPMLDDTKRLSEKLQKHHGWLEPEGYEMPKFFSGGAFRDIHLHLHAFPSVVNAQMVNIIDTSRHDPSATLEWIKKIHVCYVKSPATGSRIKRSLSEALTKVPVEGLDDLRDYILGQSIAKAAECSERRERMVRNIIEGIPAYDLESDAFVLASNPRYIEHAFLTEFTDQAQNAHYQHLEDGNDDPFQTGVKCTKDLIRLYGILGLKTDDVCRIAMKLVSNYSLGRMLDLEEEEPIVRMKAVFEYFNQFQPQEFDLHSNLLDAILCSVIRTLPEGLVSELAADNDANRLQIYTLTGNREHLAGMKDPKNLDTAMAVDLGL